MDMKTLHVKMTFTEQVLGTTAGDPELHSRFIASKAPDAKSREEEIEQFGVDEVEERTMTIFPKLDDGTPFIWDYQVRGFFKEACKFLMQSPGTLCAKEKSKKMKPYKKNVDGLIFVEPRKIPMDLPEDGEMSDLQRPLRASTPAGERIALAHSEAAPAGTCVEFDIVLLDDSFEPYVVEWLDYGKYHGMLQWRNGGFGRFEYELS